MAHLLSTRKEAKAAGAKHYFTGLRCKHGHVAKRLVSDGGCCECSSIESARKRINRPKKTTLIDLTGQRFGRLLITKYLYTEQHSWFSYVCDCGNTGKTTSNRLRTGTTKSCGCLLKERRGKCLVTHGMTKSPVYSIWQSMLNRCYNANVTHYARYGARGITVCDKWHRFENFYADMGNRPTKNHSIERLDNEGDYEPGNCIWADRKSQARNRSTNRMMTLRSKTQCLAAWAEELGWSQSTLITRVSRGWSDHRALTTVPQEKDQAFRNSFKRRTSGANISS